MDIFVRIIKITFPIFSIVALGFFCAKKFNPDMKVANQLNMDVFVPALIFSVMVGQSVDIRQYLPLILAAIVVVIGSGILVLPLAKVFNIELKTIVPPMMFNNSANMGLPLMLLTFGEAVLPIAMILFLVENTLHFTLGTAWLSAKGKNSLGSMISPLTVATLLAIVLGVNQVTIHPTVLLPIDMLGNIVIPLMLFSLGVRLSASSFKTVKIGLIGGFASPITGVLTVVLTLPWLELNPMEVGALYLFGVLPRAILNFMFAERYQQEPDKVASIVIIGNLLSIATLPIMLSYVIPNFVVG